MKVRKLAEAVILQSLEDLYDPRHRAESVDFFSGEGFHICARMAGLCPKDKLKVLKLAYGVINSTNHKNHKIVGAVGYKPIKEKEEVLVGR